MLTCQQLSCNKSYFMSKNLSLVYKLDNCWHQCCKFGNMAEYSGRRTRDEVIFWNNHVNIILPSATISCSMLLSHRQCWRMPDRCSWFDGEWSGHRTGYQLFHVTLDKDLETKFMGYLFHIYEFLLHPP